MVLMTLIAFDSSIFKTTVKVCEMLHVSSHICFLGLISVSAKSAGQRSMMAAWIRHRRLRDTKCAVHDLEVIGSNSSRVEPWVCSNSV